MQWSWIVGVIKRYERLSVVGMIKVPTRQTWLYVIGQIYNNVCVCGTCLWQSKERDKWQYALKLFVFVLTFLLVLFLLQMAGSFDPSFCKSLTDRCFTDVNTWMPIIYHESAWLHDSFTVHHFAKRNLGPPMQMRHARGFSGKWLSKDDSHPSLAANVLDFFGSGRTSRLPWSEEATCWVHQSHVIPGTFLASSLWGSWEDFTFVFF